MHPPAQDRLELVAALRVQIHRVQARAERQPRTHEAAVQFRFVTAHEQPQIGHADGLQRRRTEQRAVEERRDASQQVRGRFGAQLLDPPPPGKAAAQWKGKSPRVVHIAHHRRHLGQIVLFGARQERAEHFGVGGTPVVVGQPYPVTAERQRVQHPERETSCAAQVSA